MTKEQETPMSVQKSENATPWWVDVNLELLNGGNFGNSSPYPAMGMRAIRERKTLYTAGWDGMCSDLGALLEELGKLGIPGLALTRKDLSSSGLPSYWYTWPEGAVGLETDSLGAGTLSLSVACFDETLPTKIGALAKTYLVSRPVGSIYALVADDMGGVTIKRIGVGGQPLNHNNYSEEVIKGFLTVAKGLVDPHPFGRLSIFEGPPGTGKTHLIKALLQEVNNVDFLIVQPETIQALTGPTLLSALLDHRHSERPTVLIIEDGDSCLVERGPDNMGSISALLNLSDGLMGSVLDLRILCTTNAPKTDFDPAIRRKGRTLKHVKVGTLNKDEALRCYKAITGKDTHPELRSEMTLAEVYDLALGGDGKDTSLSSNKPGFGFGS